MYYLSSSAPQELISSHAHNLTTGDPFEEPYPAKSDDDSWLPIPNGHDAPFPTESSAENAPSSAIRSDSLGINASVSDATSNFMDAASSMGIHQQENENSPTSVAGIKHGLESPDEETGRAKSRRRKGEPEPDYSAMSRQKIMQVKRTGQACDRCKLRKLRCDPGPNGCLPCTSNKHPCQVTDRVTGETFLRGEASHLKAQNEALRAQVAELEETASQLRVENRSLQTQLFCYELMQAESESVATCGPSHVSDALVDTPHEASPDSFTGSSFRGLDS